MLTILAFIFTIGILVTVHEYGHFQMARWCGVKVLKFSIGFGKPLWRRNFGQDKTEFVIAAIPLGGYVKMLGEDVLSTEASSEHHDLSRALNRQSVGKRIAIVLAGPFANLLLAVFLYWTLFMAGVVGLKPILGGVISNTPAAMLDIRPGDLIQKINDQEVASWQDVRWILLKESLKDTPAQIQVASALGEVYRYALDLSVIDYDDTSKDILQKIGLLVYQPKIKPLIGVVSKMSPAETAGIKTGDLVLAVNQKEIPDWEAFVKEIRLYPDVLVDVLVMRDKEKITLSVKPQQITEDGEIIGRIGATFDVGQSDLDALMVTTHYSASAALAKAVGKTWETALFSLKMMWNMLLGNVSWKGMSGPVTIASYAGQSANMGVKVFIGFLALISISIGVLNLLPIPILDGGHFMYYMVEFFTGKPVSENVMIIGQKLGLAILGFMMVLALFNDINRLITG
ncbi:MAG: RIP metalloprotease RseP [Betaproteobacteria bacterium HGW-Betaproteobacteria-22]|nr:MAG: RIP metalloprotease RseP [Betaproteobacteria bacterium HGW-Betaproteobacteria-22]